MHAIAPIKPARLRRGDALAAVSLSSGGPARFPSRYAAGKRQIEETFGVRVIEAPHALANNDWLYRNPAARADDLHWALNHPDISAIVSTIGGDDSVRVLPFIDLDLIRSHPKIMLGLSDATITLSTFARAGVVCFYGTAVMSDLAESGGIRPFVERAIKSALFEARPFALEASGTWSEEHLPWADPESQDRRRNFVANDGWKWLQGGARVRGRLIGGCLEVLEFIKGTRWSIPAEMWDGAVMFFETSEEAPPPRQVGYFMRSYAAQGILQRLAGMLIGRPMGYTQAMVAALYNEVRRILAEAGREDLTVVANLDFGHTSPQMVLPIGCEVLIDPDARRIEILESPVA